MKDALWVTLGLTWLLGTPVAGLLLAMCPPKPNDKSESFCECVKENGRSGPIVKITCNFNRDQDVLLTRALYPFHASRVVSAYVRVADAKSVHVTRSFLEEWQSVPATALDLWRAGTLNFDVLYEYGNLHAYSPYRTNRNRRLLRPRNSRQIHARPRPGRTPHQEQSTFFRKGAFFNIKQMRYLVIEDSAVSVVEGPVSASGVVTLSQRSLHSWVGFRLHKVLVNSLGAGAFNITHSTEVESVEVSNCRFQEVSTGAFSVSGNLNVSFSENTFGHLQKEALKVSVTGEVKFDGNLIDTWDSDALSALRCFNRSSLQRNTVRVVAAQEAARNITPFHSSCGNPQIFTVISSPSALESMSSSAALWTLAVMAILLLLLLVAGVLLYRRRGLMMRHYKRDTPIFLSVCKASADNVANGPEHAAGGDAPAGVTNPMYEEGTPIDEEECE
nr:uncharacterized protein LOC113814783 [Penaeus vannamei]